MIKKKEKVVIIGFGWVGQANALALHKMGYPVFFYDPQTPTRYYPEYNDMYDKAIALKGPLDEDGEDTWYIVCVGDSVSEEGEQDISLIKKALETLKGARGGVILRSTILPKSVSELSYDIYFPEFLHEKYAVEECENPYYFALGKKTERLIPSFLKIWQRKAFRVFNGTPEEASYIKYLSNLWNSTKIAFVNEFGDGIVKPIDNNSIKKIENIIDFVFDKESYLKYGQSFKGHCLPKDTRAYVASQKKEGKNVTLLEAVYTTNQLHEKLEKEVGGLPEWYAFWDYKKLSEEALIRLYENLNSLVVIQKIRKELRFIVDFIATLIPDRTLADTKKIWEKKAQENALYYSSFTAKNKEELDEKKFRESGDDDFSRYILSDHILLGELGDLSDKRVLDIGSGAGRMILPLSTNFKEVYGIDIAPTMVRLAKERFDSISNVLINETDGVTVPYNDEYFDFIFSHATLHHIPTKKILEQYVREIHRALRKGGVAKLQFATGRGVKKWEWSHGVCLTLEEAQDMAEKSGFHIISHYVEDMDNLWLSLKK